MLVPDRDGKHPPQALEASGPFLLIEVDDRLGIRHRPEDVSLPLQLSSQLLKVVDLAVEYATDGAILVEYRLIASHEVDDREPAIAQRDEARLVYKEPLSVGASVSHHPEHSQHLLLIHLAGSMQSYLSGNSAHGTSSSLPTRLRLRW